MSEKLVHEIVFYPAYDKRNVDPNKNYGIHGVDMRWYVKGKKGAVQFVIYTNWYLPEVAKELEIKQNRMSTLYYNFFKPMPADLGYHSPVPHYKDQSCKEDCEVIGKPCYYDGSTLNAEPVFDILLQEGSEAVWKYLDEYYYEVFGDET